MALIDIGAAATDRNINLAPAYTGIDLENPANDTGTLTSIEIWLALDGSGVKVFTASRDGDKFTPRDVVTLADITAGSKVTRTTDVSSNPIALEVESGDYIGVYTGGGRVERGASGGSGFYYKAGDQTAAGEQTYTLASGEVLSLYATGVTPVTTSIKTLNGTAIGLLVRWNGKAIDDYKTIMGISNVD